MHDDINAQSPGICGLMVDGNIATLHAGRVLNSNKAHGHCWASLWHRDRTLNSRPKTGHRAMDKWICPDPLSCLAMARAAHTFDNGIKVYDDHLLPLQRERYKKHNVHEADEEEHFINIIRSLPPDGVYLDIGAAVGYYAMLARRLSPPLPSMPWRLFPGTVICSWRTSD